MIASLRAKFVRTPLQALALMLLALPSALLAVGCAKVPPIEGAPCGCPPGYGCKDGVCVQGWTGPMTPPSSMPDADTTTMTPLLDRCFDHSPTLLRRLTGDEYANSVRDLLGVEADLGLFVRDVSSGTFLNSAVDQSVSAIGAEGFLRLGEQVAEQAIAHLDTLLACDRRAEGDAVCGHKFVERFGRRAFRRPLDEDERMNLRATFDAGVKDEDFTEGVRRAIAVTLGSPQFLYRLETGLPPSGNDPFSALTPWELATRLSYFLWGSTPDDQLLAEAESGSLGDRRTLLAQAERLLGDERAARMLTGFHREWLGYDSYELEHKLEGAAEEGSDVAFPQAVRAAILPSIDAFVKNQVWQNDTDRSSWFTANTIFGDEAMARYYGLETPSAPGLIPLRPTGDQLRFGLLTQPAFLAAHAHGQASAPVMRGLALIVRVMCETLPPPPAGVPPLPGPVDPSATTRERFAMHSNNPGCAVCHLRFDPLGFGLENFDGLGVWRTKENGHDIDTSGHVDGFHFSGLGEMAAHFAGTGDATVRDQVDACVARQWFRFSFGREAIGADPCTVAFFKDAFVAGGRRLRPLLKAITQSNAFNSRYAPPRGAR